MVGRAADGDAAGRVALSAFARPRDWADVAALFDRTLRVFSDVVRPALRGLPASKLSHSNLLLLVAVASDTQVRQADLIRDANLIASNAGYALKALRDAGYVEVEMDPTNRRLRIVYATEEGRRVAGVIRSRCRLLGDRDAATEFLGVADRFERGLRAAGAKPVAKAPPRAGAAVRTERPRRAAVQAAPLQSPRVEAKVETQAESKAEPGSAPPVRREAVVPARPPSAAAAVQAAPRPQPVSAPVSAPPPSAKPPQPTATKGAGSGSSSGGGAAAAPPAKGSAEPVMVPTLFGLEPGKLPRRRPG